jgi:copper resistance protein D
MEALLVHSHLLDGALGRAAAYMATALLMGLLLWHSHHVSAYSNLRWSVSAVMLGWLGALMVLHGILAEQAAPFQTPGSMGNASITANQVMHLLFQTGMGHSWMLYLLLLTLAATLVNIRFVRLPTWLLLSLPGGMLLCLAATSHAGEQGLGTWIFWLDVTHMGLALTWLGGLMVMAISRLSGGHAFTWAHLRTWSRLALALFSGALLTGVLRLYAQFAENGTLAWTYIGVLLIKAAAIAGIIVAAAGLRKLLHGQENSQRYDRSLSNEVFCAFMLVMATAMLTQLPSW